MKKQVLVFGAFAVLMFVFLVAGCGQQHKSPFEVTDSEQNPITFQEKLNPDAEVKCTCGGCTRTMGYWKNHPDEWKGYAPDDMFSFFGMTIMEVLNTPPRGNADIILAHQYIAAFLNDWSGASTTVIADADHKAMLYFWGQIDLTRSEIIALAEVLDAYNNGNMGVPHCDDGD